MSSSETPEPVPQESGWSPEQESRGRSRRSRREKPKPTRQSRADRLKNTLILVIVLLVGVLTVVIAAGVFWVGMIQGEAGNLKTQLADAQAELASLAKSLEKARRDSFPFKAVEQGTLEGRILYRVDGKTYDAGTTEVLLYDRAKLEKAVDDAITEFQATNPGASLQSAAALTFLMSRLPPADVNTMTDATGIFTIPTPKYAEMAVVSRTEVSKSISPTGLIFWMVGFDQQRAAERPLVLDENNQVNFLAPGVSIKKAD